MPGPTVQSASAPSSASACSAMVASSAFPMGEEDREKRSSSCTRREAEFTNSSALSSSMSHFLLHLSDDRLPLLARGRASQKAGPSHSYVPIGLSIIRGGWGQPATATLPPGSDPCRREEGDPPSRRIESSAGATASGT